MTILASIKAEIEELKNKFNSLMGTAPEAKPAKSEDEPKEEEPKGENEDEPKEEEDKDKEAKAALTSLEALTAKVEGIDLEAIKAEAKAEVTAEIKADLEKEFEARVAAAAAEKLASNGAAPLQTGASTKEDKETLKGLKGRALTAAVIKLEREGKL